MGTFRPDLIMKASHPLCSSGVKTDGMGIAVVDSCGYGWYHRCVLSRYFGLDRWRRETSTEHLFVVRVRT